MLIQRASTAVKSARAFTTSFDGKVIVTTPRAGRSAVRRTTVIRLLCVILRKAYEKERPLRGLDIGPIV